MLKRVEIDSLNDYFTELNSRKNKGVYFYRITTYSEEIKDFVVKYYERARKNGVIIEGKIQNPTEQNLSYYNEIMGDSFQLSVGFFMTSLKKWLPRMDNYQTEVVAIAIYDTLEILRKSGKNENMLKNAYIKFMCWMYFKFERIISQLGDNNIPKILYEGNIGRYELLLISILSNAGCDVVLLQYAGDNKQREFFEDYKEANSQKFPEDFSLKKVREIIEENINRERLYGISPSIKRCTNAWIEGKNFEDIKKDVVERGTDKSFFYNYFCRVKGAEDRMQYASELYKLQLDLKNANRNPIIINGEIPIPTVDEISKVKRHKYNKVEDMLMDLSVNLRYTANIELERLMKTAFIDTLLEYKGSINRVTNKAVYLICWLNRYKTKLFSNWNPLQIGCFILFGGCKDEDEALFLKFLSRLPVDILILCPNPDEECCLEDNYLYEINFPEVVSLKEFPEGEDVVKMGTVAYHAEKELDEILYKDSGLFRNNQYSKVNIINLQTMYEEIEILWDEELKYRPNFLIKEDKVSIPVIFAKVSGVKNGDLIAYWDSIRKLMVEDTILIENVPYIDRYTQNPMQRFAVDFYKNGKLQKSKIKNHPQFPYGILRDEMQDLIIDKLETIIEQKLIKGIGENGTEYTVISVALNIPRDILRLIQKFDFTKKNPKLIYINTDEKIISLEDTILITLLNLIGFDIVFFVPTGYQSIEKYFNKNLIVEHQIGEYRYDLKIPDFKNNLLINSLNWRDKIFKRGR